MRLATFLTSIFLPLLSATSATAQITRHVAIDAATLPSDVLIGRMVGAVQLSGGTLVVADNIERKLHLFDSAGRYLRSAGRLGKGPGEFTGIGWIGECARDSVFVLDQKQGRVSVFSARGDFVRTATPPVAHIVLMNCARDGTTVIAVPSANAVQNLGGSIIVAAPGADTATIRGVLIDQGKPLGASLRIAVGTRRVYYGAGDSPGIMQWEPNRTVTLPVAVAARTPTAAHKDAAIEELATRFPGTEGDYADMRRGLRKMPAATRLPFYTGLFFDEETNGLWVSTSSLGDPATILRAIGSTGRGTDEIRLPADVRIFQVRGGTVIGKEIDPATGEETLYRYRLQAAK